jgi:hypothetical protein
LEVAGERGTFGGGLQEVVMVEVEVVRRRT